jgi:hypothetical protein
MGQGMTTAERTKVLGYRLSGHHLSEKVPTERLLEAAGACGVQNTPPGSAALSLLARVDGLTPMMLRSALLDRSLMEAWSMRASPHLFPTALAGVFGPCLVPDESSMTDVVIGIVPLLDEMRLDMPEAYRMAERAVRKELDGTEMPKAELAVRAARRIAPTLSVERQEVWGQDSGIGRGATKGEAIVRFALYLMGMRGVVCFAEHRDGRSPLALTEQWLGHGVEAADCHGLVKRYLRCYGPSTERHFAEWCGVGLEHATAIWRRAEEGMSEIIVDGRTMWLLDEQVKELEGARLPRGARLLPPHDPYLQQRDRAILVPQQERRRELWRGTGSPGAVLCEGEIVGTWRPRKSGSTLRLEVRPYGTLSDEDLGNINEEADLMEPFRNVASVNVVIV